MKPVGILSASGGIDVLSPETELKGDRVRVAENVVLHKGGGFDRRDAAERVATVTRPHSMWRTQDGEMTLYVAGGTLYRLTGPKSSLVSTALATGLWANPARYTEHGGDVYVTAGINLRVTRSDVVTTPGVTSLLSFSPTLTETTGGLPAGRYGVAFSAISASGEESGLSGISWIELAASSGIAVSLLPSAPAGVTRYRVYRTGTNDDKLRVVETLTATSSMVIAGGDVGRQAMHWPLDMLPSGTEIKSHKGRLWVSLGSFLFFSEAMAPGLYDPRKNFFAFGSDILMFEPVDEGIYVGTSGSIYFLRGAKPNEMSLELVAMNGAVRHSSMLVNVNQLDGSYIDTKKPCAVWISPEHGYQIGKPSGTVLSPQADKVSLSGIERAPSIAFTRGGVKQIVSATETVTLGNGGASDSTP